MAYPGYGQAPPAPGAGGYGHPPPAAYPGQRAPQPGQQPHATGYPGQQPPTAGYPGQQPPAGGYPGQQAGYPPQGYGAPPTGPPGCPPGVAPDVYTWFVAVDTDKSGQITAKELQAALTNGNWSNFNAETCRLMIGIFDRDNSGTIDVREFQQLWAYINQWKGTFDRYDKDRSGNIDAGELFTAYNEMGFRVSAKFCQVVVTQFDRMARRSLKFDDFIQSCVMLRALTDNFRTRDTNQDGCINVNYEDFLTMAIANKP